MFYWWHLGKASYFQMFRSSFHPIPPSPSSGIYWTVASIKNDKEHLTWILLCRVQNVLLFPFTERRKWKPETPNILTFKELCLFWCLFSGEPMTVSADPTQEPFLSLNFVDFKGNLPVYISLSTGFRSSTQNTFPLKPLWWFLLF